MNLGVIRRIRQCSQSLCDGDNRVYFIVHTIYQYMSLKYSKLFVVFLLLALWSCQEDEEIVAPVPDQTTPVPSSSSELRDTTFRIMQEWYLWNEEMPDVDPEDYASADDLLQALKYRLDKWSYITEEEEYDDFFTRGEYEGYGFGWNQDEEGKLRVTLVYQDSPFGRAGVGRGWIINRVNGQQTTKDTNINSLIPEATNTFEFINAAGETVTETLTKSKININTVLHHEVIDVGNKKVGYLVFNSFLQTSADELKPVFEEFQQAGIDDLILDLRYNGGGRVSVAEYIAGNIIGQRGTDRTFLQYAYNNNIQAAIDADLEAKEDITTKFQTPDFPLDLDQLVVIASGRTASASELLINGLRPFMDVLIVGENTHGKPVGSFAFRYGGYAISPISFKVINDNGEGEYFGGFPVDAAVADDITRSFGDPEEARLKEALNFVKTGAFTVAGGARTASSAADKDNGLRGFEWEIGTL